MASRERIKATISGFFGQLIRKKTLEIESVLETPFRRCLNVVDLLFLGLGHMIGAGIYVLTGTVAKNTAGPAIVLAFLIAAIAAALSSLCYAEFGARVPKAGSSYTYTYIAIGELLAFIVGWSMILENVIGASSVAKAWSGYFDSFFQGAIKNGTMKYIGSIDVPWFADYPDFVALAVVVIASVAVAIGTKLSATFNNILSVVNISILLFITGLSFCFAKSENWTSVEGGFFPFGISGVISGAGTCFFSYVGFEGIAVAGEEAMNPSRTIPMATGLAVAIASCLYMASSASLTLMIPYNLLDSTAPYPAAFDYNNVAWAKYIVSTGALFAMSSVILNSIYCLPRLIYSMASDGLLFRFLASVHPKTQTPLVSIVVSGLIAGTAALVFDIEVLVELLSIGTLLGFTIVAVNVIILRYKTLDLSLSGTTEEPRSVEKVDVKKASAATVKDDLQSESQHTSDRNDLIEATPHNEVGRLKKSLRRLPFFTYLESLPPGRVCSVSVTSLVVFIVVFCLIISQGMWYLINAIWWAVLVLVISIIGIVVSLLMLCFYEQDNSVKTFQVPFVPLLPGLSLVMNIFMMLLLNKYTWIRLFVWTAIGLLIYFGYGIRHSTERQPLLADKGTQKGYSSLEETPASIANFKTSEQK